MPQGGPAPVGTFDLHSKLLKHINMGTISEVVGALEFAQIGWVVPDIRKAASFLEMTLGVAGFPEPERVQALELGMSYKGALLAGEWLTTQTFNGGTFIELVQPLSGQSMFHDFLAKHPEGGAQHLAFRLPVDGFDQVTDNLRGLGCEVISAVDHPIARMQFFDTYDTLGLATEIMGVTPEGWDAVRKMEEAGRRAHSYARRGKVQGD